MGELTPSVFMISQFLWGCNQESFQAPIFLGASENESFCGFPLRKDLIPHSALQNVVSSASSQ